METVPHNMLIPICNHTFIYTISNQGNTHACRLQSFKYYVMHIRKCIAKGTCIPIGIKKPGIPK